MTNFEDIKSMSLEAFAKWLDKHGQFDNSPWMTWFDENYCNKCESIECHYAECEEKLGIEPLYNSAIKCAWCELENKCKYFPDIDWVPDNIDIIKMWLNEQKKEGE